MTRQDANDLLVVCLCAEWCTACNEFRGTFDDLAREQPGTAFFWLDIEYESALVGDVEIENFPTLAVFRGSEPLFFGATLPHAGVIARTLAALRAPEREAIAVPEEIAALAGAIVVRGQSGDVAQG